MATQTVTTYYSPSAIISTFNAALQNLTERKILPIKGIYQFVEGSKYGGYFYDKLKDEATDKSIKLLVPELLRKDLKNNTTIEIHGYVARKLDNYGRIELQIVITEFIEQSVNRYTEEDSKKIELLNKKAAVGLLDLDLLIKKKIYEQQKITIHVVIGRNAIIDNDIIKQMSEGIISLDTPDTDAICVSRGGGENIELFDKPEIAAAALDRNCVIVSAIGHADNVTLFENIADKKFTAPTAFGQYLKETYNNTVHDYEQSKAKLVDDVTKSLKANYEKQLSNLAQQLTAEKELKTKTLADKEALFAKTITEAKNLHTTQVEGLKKQMETLQAQSTALVQEKEKVLADKEKILNTRITALAQEKEEKDKLIAQARNVSEQFKANADSLQQQIVSLQSSNTKAIVIAGIIALIFGLIIGKALL